MIYIYAPTREAAYTCAKLHGMHINDWAFISDLALIKDKMRLSVWLYGSWHTRFDYTEAARIFERNQFTLTVMRKVSDSNLDRGFIV